MLQDMKRELCIVPAQWLLGFFGCHPERSDSFATRGCHAVAGSLHQIGRLGRSPLRVQESSTDRNRLGALDSGPDS
jgi:hypothetical protein